MYPIRADVVNFLGRPVIEIASAEFGRFLEEGCAAAKDTIGKILPEELAQIHQHGAVHPRTPAMDKDLIRVLQVFDARVGTVKHDTRVVVWGEKELPQVSADQAGDQPARDVTSPCFTANLEKNSLFAMFGAVGADHNLMVVVGEYVATTFPLVPNTCYYVRAYTAAGENGETVVNGFAVLTLGS